MVCSRKIHPSSRRKMPSTAFTPSRSVSCLRPGWWRGARPDRNSSPAHGYGSGTVRQSEHWWHHFSIGRRRGRRSHSHGDRRRDQKQSRRLTQIWAIIGDPDGHPVTGRARRFYFCARVRVRDTGVFFQGQALSQGPKARSPFCRRYPISDGHLCSRQLIAPPLALLVSYVGKLPSIKRGRVE